MKLDIKRGLQIAFHLFLIALWTALWYFDDLSENPGKTPDLFWFIPVAMILLQVFVQRFVLWVMIWIFFDLLFLLPAIAPIFRWFYDQTFIYASVSGYLFGLALLVLLNVAFYLFQPREIPSKPITGSTPLRRV